MATKRTPVPGEVDKLIAHQSRLLKAPRIAGHYQRLAEQGRAAGWSLEDYPCTLSPSRVIQLTPPKKCGHAECSIHRARCTGGQEGDSHDSPRP
jgi:hypothetical protein